MLPFHDIVPKHTEWRINWGLKSHKEASRLCKPFSSLARVLVFLKPKVSSAQKPKRRENWGGTRRGGLEEYLPQSLVPLKGGS